MNKLGNTGRCRRPRNSAGAVAVNGVKILTAAFIKDTNQIDNRIGTVDSSCNRRIVANIGGHRRNLADVTHRFATQGFIGAATGDANMGSLACQRPDNRATEKSGTTKNRDNAIGHLPLLIAPKGSAAGDSHHRASYRVEPRQSIKPSKTVENR